MIKKKTKNTLFLVLYDLCKCTFDGTDRFDVRNQPEKKNINIVCHCKAYELKM